MKKVKICNAFNEYVENNPMTYLLDGKTVDSKVVLFLPNNQSTIDEMKVGLPYSIEGYASFENSKNARFDCIITVNVINGEKKLAVIKNQINLSILQCYHVSFTIRGKSYDCYGYSHSLTEKNAEAFAWGIIRSHVKSLNMPLDGYATNVAVHNLNDGWSWDIIPLTSDIENN